MWQNVQKMQCDRDVRLETRWRLCFVITIGFLQKRLIFDINFNFFQRIHIICTIMCVPKFCGFFVRFEIIRYLLIDPWYCSTSLTITFHVEMINLCIIDLQDQSGLNIFIYIILHSIIAHRGTCIFPKRWDLL